MSHAKLPRASHPCQGKFVYKNRRQATTAINRSNLSESLSPVACYKCPICRFWHVGRTARTDTLMRQDPVDKRIDQDDEKTYHCEN